MPTRAHALKGDRSVDSRRAPRLRLIPGTDAVSDEDLMLRYRDGDASAFDALVQRHRGRVFGYLRRMGLRPARADELVADVFLKLHRAAPRYEVSAKFTTFLYTIAYRAALNAREKAHHQLDRPIGDSGDLDGRHSAPTLGSDPERSLAVKRAFAAVDRELQALPEGHRAAFVLYYKQGLGCGEIADALGISSAEAKGRLAYARKLLRSRLDRLLEERRD